jgi:hypothetical protein
MIWRFVWIRTNLVALVHQQCTTCKSGCAGCCVLPAIAAALLLLLLTTPSGVVRILLVCTLVAVAILTITIPTLWWWSTVVALLLRVAGPGVLVGPLAVVLVHKYPTVFASIPFSIPWWGDWWWLLRVLWRWVLRVALLLLLLLVVLTRASKVGDHFAKEAHGEYVVMARWIQKLLGVGMRFVKVGAGGVRYLFNHGRLPLLCTNPLHLQLNLFEMAHDA